MTDLPRLVALELTARCNHRCEFCSNPWTATDRSYPIPETEKSAEDWIRIIDRFIDLGVRTFCLTGGEPTLHPGFKSIVEHLCTLTEPHAYHDPKEGVKVTDRPVPFSILTNGDTDIFTTEYCNLIAPSVTSISINLVGDRELHATHVGGDYDRVIGTFKSVAASEITLVHNLTLYHGNIDQATRTVQTAIDLGASHIFLLRPLPVGRCKGIQDRLPSPGEIIYAIQQIRGVCSDADVGMSMGTIMTKCAFPEQELDRVQVEYLCSCGVGSFCVGPDGTIRPCTCSNVVTGTVDDPIAVVNGPSYQTFLRRHHPPVCSGCEHMMSCSGGCPAAWYWSPSHGGMIDICMRDL